MKKLISWVEIPATDMQRAVSFYEKILDFKLEILDFGAEKMACFPSGEGAISLAPDFKPGSNGVLVSLNAEDDLDGSLVRVKDSGGQITIPKTKIQAEGRGFFAVFVDSEGNKLGLYGN